MLRQNCCYFFVFVSIFKGEHSIDGKHFPLEAHFVHFACDDITIGNALETYETDDDPHILAVVAIMYEVGGHNPAFDAILNRGTLKKIQFPDDLETPNITGWDIIDNLDLSDLIPNKLETKGYYAYEGSLTTPPCTDVVRWHIMKATSTVSESQLEKLRTLMNDVGETIAPNYREIQENINDVYDCSSKGSVSEEFIDSQFLGMDIPTHATLTPKSVVMVVTIGSAICLALLCLLLCYTKFQRSNVDINVKNIFGKNDADTCISDTEPDEPESDALIYRK